LAAEVLAGQIEIARLPGSTVIRGGHVILGLKGNIVARVNRPGHRSGRKSGHRSAWAHAQIASHRGRAGICHRAASEHGECAGRSKRGPDSSAHRCWHQEQRQQQ